MTTDRTLRFAMMGMVPGNGHPYSWSAIVNSYDQAAMAACPYPGIAKYLGGEPFESVRVPGAQVTHIWTDDPKDAPLVARASLIPHVVKRPEDALGQVDGVFVAAGEGFDHVARARPFVEAGLPVFVDKPLALSIPELQTFIDWKKAGARILSSSSHRYSPEIESLLNGRPVFGDVRWVSTVMAKDYENYAIHAFEPVFRLLGPGFVSVRLEGPPKFEVAQMDHASGAQVTMPIVYDCAHAATSIQVCGTAGQLTARLSGTDHTYYTAFRRQVVAFVDFVRAGAGDPYPFSETVEMMAVLIAGRLSRAEGHRRVEVAEVFSQLRR